MLQMLSANVKNCLERAERARTLANESQDPKMNEFYLQMETHWLCLAASYQVSERLKRYLLIRSKSSSEWHPICVSPPLSRPRIGSV
jgi:hypothetical protein